MFQRKYQEALQNLRKIPESLLDDNTIEKTVVASDISSPRNYTGNKYQRGAKKELSNFKISDINIFQKDKNI